MINQTICLDENFSTTRMLTTMKPVISRGSEGELESVLFLPKGRDRISDGGLRTRGYFKDKTKGEPLVSVITVVFNAATYLAETIESVINQTYPNIEYIIIDAGSTDGTLDIIKEYEHAIDYWVSEPDKGIYDAMNKGILASSGQYTNFLNAGDSYFSSSTISGVVECLRSGYDIVYGKALYVNRNGSYVNKFFPQFTLDTVRSGMIDHQSTFYDASVFRRFGLYDLRYKFLADYEHLIRVLKGNGTTQFTNETHVLYVEEGYNSSHWFSSTTELFLILRRHFGLSWAIYTVLKKALRKLLSSLIAPTLKIRIKRILYR